MNNSVYQPTVTLTGDGSTGTIILPVDMVAGNNSLELVGGQDFAQAPGFAIAKVTKTFTFAADNTSIVATVKKSTEKSVTLKFNKKIPGFENNANLRFSHTYKGQNEVTNAAITKVADDEYTVTFATPFAPGTVSVFVDYAANTADANKVKDSYGNILNAFSVNVSTLVDASKPLVSSVDFKDSTTVKVAFSEAVDTTLNGANSATNVANYVLKDAEGKVVAVTGVANPSADKKTFELTTSQLNGGVYTLEVKNVVDLAISKNKLDTVTKSFVATDKVAPTVTTTAEVINSKKVKIKFSEAMDKASIEDKANYGVDSKVKITAAVDNKSVVLDYTDVTPAVDFLVGTAVDTIQVGQVKDLAGNKTANFVTAVTVTHLNGAAPTITAKEVRATAAKKIEIDVEDVLTVQTGATLAVSLDGGTVWADASVLSTTIINGVTTLTLELPTAIAVTTTSNVKVASGTVAAGVLTQAASTTIKNADGAFLNITATVAKDKLAPVVVSRVTGDSDANGKIDEIVITFSEALFAGSVAATDFAVEGYVIEGVKSINGAAVTLTVKEGVNADYATATPKVTVTGSVEDALHNASVAESTGVDATKGI